MKKIFMVGGAVRDKIRNTKNKDVDFVVVGSTIEEMLADGFTQVGAHFPVFLDSVTKHEFALARKEFKTGNGHKDFEFDFNPNITLEEDLVRRDFTMNAIAMDMESNELIDPFGGISDIHSKIIRHINSEFFVQDPLRILRALRFATVFDFNIHDDTKALLKDMVSKNMLKDLTPERIWNEIEKSLGSLNFFRFIELLDEIGGLNDIFPELEKCKTCKENVVHHPEGDTFSHIMLCLKQVEKNVKTFGIFDIKHINFAVLFHDIGKIKELPENHPKFHSHDEDGIEVIEEICTRMKIPNVFLNFAKLAIRHHMVFCTFNERRFSKKFRLLKEITDNFRNINNWLFVFNISVIDKFGRDKIIDVDMFFNIFKIFFEGNGIIDIAKEINASMFPELEKFKGKDFGVMLDEAKIKFIKNKLRSL